MKTLLYLLPSVIWATVIPTGKTVIFTSPVELNQQRIRFSLWSPNGPPDQLSITAPYPLDIVTGGGYRTTTVNGVRTREYVWYIQATSLEYLVGSVGEIRVTNKSSKDWLWDQTSINIRYPSGVNYGLVPTFYPSEEVTRSSLTSPGSSTEAWWYRWYRSPRDRRLGMLSS